MNTSYVQLMAVVDAEGIGRDPTEPGQNEPLATKPKKLTDAVNGENETLSAATPREVMVGDPLPIIGSDACCSC